MKLTILIPLLSFYLCILSLSAFAQEQTSTSNTTESANPESSSTEPSTPVQQNQNQSQPASISDENPQVQNQTTDTNTEVKDQKPKMYGGLLLPQVRKGTNFSVQSHTICGGTKRERTHYITTQNVSNEFKWLIESPYPNGRCFFRVNTGVYPNEDQEYIPLIPQDDHNNITSEDGWFDCGKAKGVEKVYLKFSEDIDCDACILEWIWKTPDFEIRQCADISVLSEQSEKCRNICENGGVCHKGSCVCRQGYTGEYCEISTSSTIRRMLYRVPHIAFYVILAIIFAMGIVGLIFWFVKKRKTNQPPQQVNVRAVKAGERYQQFDNEQQVSKSKPAIQLAVKV